jgi:hypothetical protein
LMKNDRMPSAPSFPLAHVDGPVSEDQRRRSPRGDASTS